MSNMALPGMKNTNIKNEKASLINTADLSPKIDNKVSEKTKKTWRRIDGPTNQGCFITTESDK